MNEAGNIYHMQRYGIRLFAPLYASLDSSARKERHLMRLLSLGIDIYPAYLAV